MKQYYYLDGSTQLGPFGLDELRTKGLMPDTLVWAVGMPGWTKAGEVPELSTLFQGGLSTVVDPMTSTPPAYTPATPVSTPTPGYQPPNTGAAQSASAYFASTPKPKNWLVESILATIFCCLPFGIAGIVFAARVDSAYASGDINGAMKASAEAGKWTKVSFFVAIAGWVLYMLFFGAAFMAALNSNRY